MSNAQENGHSDFVVVGGGPAGAVFSLLAARSGYRVALLEANRETKRKVCGEYLCPRGVTELHDLGLSKALAHGRKLEGMRLVAPSGEAVSTHFPKETVGISVHRDLLDRELLRKAESEGVQVILGHRAERILKTPSGWRVEADGQSYTARILVGADGRQSMISRLLENEKKHKCTRVAIHAWIPSSRETGSMGEMHILKDGSYLGLNPTGSDEWNVSWVVDQSVLKGIDPSEAMRTLISESKVLSDKDFRFSNEIRIHSAYPIQHLTKSIVGSNWALIGDAAGFLDPLTGEGLYQAIHSAHILWDSFRASRDGLEINARKALSLYRANYSKEFRQKRFLNRVLQWVIRKPQLCDQIGQYLGKKQERADAFIGVIANTTSPVQGFWKMIHS
jgi:menaquinone-9 beta-reductase